MVRSEGPVSLSQLSDLKVDSDPNVGLLVLNMQPMKLCSSNDQEDNEHEVELENSLPSQIDYPKENSLDEVSPPSVNHKQDMEFLHTDIGLSNSESMSNKDLPIIKHAAWHMRSQIFQNSSPVNINTIFIAICSAQVYNVTT